MLFSEQFGITLRTSDKWFDPVLSLDTRLFIDPFLIYADEEGVFVGSHVEVVNFFKSCFMLLASSKGDPGTPAYKKAVGNLVFPEVEEFCLGYTSNGTRGAGSGQSIARLMAGALWQAIEVGMKDIRHFELVALLREGIGADRISDITACLLRNRFAQYTAAICVDHGIPTVTRNYVRGFYDVDAELWKPISFDLPTNPFNLRPILLTPRKYVRALPTLNDGDFWEYCYANENETIRANVNYDISSKVPKKVIVEFARGHPEILGKYCDVKENKSATPYDFVKDELGYVVWYKATKRYCDDNPLTLTVTSEEDLKTFVKSTADEFQLFVGDRGGWELLWKGPEHKDEAAAQLLYLGIVKHYAAALNIVIFPEQNVGKGVVKLTTEGGKTIHASLEVKLARNGRFRNSLASEVPNYPWANKAHIAVILIVSFKKAELKKCMEVKASAAKLLVPYPVYCITVDASPDTSGTRQGRTTNINVTGNSNTINMENDMSESINISGGVTGSAVGSHASLNARDITSYKNSVDNSTKIDDAYKTTLKTAREAIETANITPDAKKDAIDALEKITAELEQPKPDKSRIGGWIASIATIVPPVATALNSLFQFGKSIISGE